MYSYKLWDKKSKINGVNAEDVIAIHKIDMTGEAGLIVDETGKAVVFQYNNANPFSVDEITKLLEQMTDEMNRAGS